MSQTIDPILAEDPNQLTLPRVLPEQPDTLRTIINLANRLVAVRAVQENLTKELGKFAAEEKDLSEKIIPDMLASIGLTELQLASGQKIAIKDDVYASIPKARASEAFDWLRSRNMGSIIKEVITVDAERKEALMAATIPFSVAETIHPSTLRALAREQVEAGNEFPRELFGVHVATKAVIKD